MQENASNPQTDKELILAGLCPKNHETDDRVCKGCYEDLLKKYNALQKGSNKTKSQWQTW